MKWFKRVLLGLFVLFAGAALLVVIIINPFGPSRLNRYQTDGRLNLDGLKKPVKVYRDEKQMAYIYAENADDLFLAQGYVTATDRLFQMELTRRLACGRIGEVVGATAFPIDATMRTIGFCRHAQEHFKKLDDRTKRTLKQYVDGINAFIRTRPEEVHLEFKIAGVQADAWRPQDILAVLYFMGWNSAANLQHEIIGQMLVEKLGPTKAVQLFPLNVNPAESNPQLDNSSFQKPQAAQFDLLVMQNLLNLVSPKALNLGSNNWAVNAQRSQSGRPIVANDPHLDASIIPGPWYPVGLILPDNRAVGVNIPGTPGMAVGRTNHMAFGVTNAYADTQDLYIETIDPENPDRYMEGTRSFEFEVMQETLKFKDKKAPDGYTEKELRIRKTRRGPVISDIMFPIKTDKVITLRWSAFENMVSSLNFERFFTCKNSDEFRETLKSVRHIALNYVFADTQGNIGWQVTGSVPVRSAKSGRLPYAVTDGEDNWRGWIPFEKMPHDGNPTDGWLGTANHKTVGSDYPYYYSNYFAGSFRQKRLMDIMNRATAATSADDHWQYQRDIVNLKAEKIAPLIAQALAKSRKTDVLGQILATWNGKDSADQPAPTIFHTVFSEFARLVYSDELGEDLAHAMLSNTYFWEERLVQMMIEGDSPWFDNINTQDKMEDLDTLLQTAAVNVMDRLEKDLDFEPHSWLWGLYHQYEFVSPIARTGGLKDFLGGGKYEAQGSGDTLNRSKFIYDQVSKVAVMASLRMVADLGDPDKILGVLPGGVTDRHFHPHRTDQIESFLNGDHIYWWFSDKAIKSHTEHLLTMAP